MHFQGELLHARLLKSICHLLTSRRLPGWAVLGRGSRAGMSQGSSGVTQAQLAPHRPHSPIPSCISSDSQQGFLRYPEFHIICHSRHIPR